ELSVTNVPSITMQPTDQRVPAGESATFQLTASALGALTYRWQRNGTNVNGATNNSFTLPVTPADDSAVLRAVVSNAFGSVTSNPVQLLLSAPNTAPVPQIIL